MRGSQATTRGRRTEERTRRTRGARRATSRSRRTTRTSCSACGAMRTARPGEELDGIAFNIQSQLPGPITVTTGSGIMCRNMQKRTTRIFSRYLWWSKPTFHFVHPLTPALPGLPGREGDGAGEGEQVEGRGDQGRGGQEGGGEEARGGGAREEARQGRHPRQVEDCLLFFFTQS